MIYLPSIKQLENLARMNRLDRKSRLTDETLVQLAKIDTPVIWLVITEGWCGDAAQIVPVLQHMATENKNIQLRFILRDKNLEIIDAFLTNGARSIPKILILDAESLAVQYVWGPRPAVMQEMVLSNKAKSLETEDLEAQKLIMQESANQLHLWYAKDKTKTTQTEFLSFIA